MSLLTAIRARVGPRFASWLEARAQKQIERHATLVDWLGRYKKRSSSTGCSYSDYLALYTYVRTYKPQEVLECGTGFSTLVLAYALMENERDYGLPWRLTSLEENPEYYELARKSLPAELVADPRIQLLLSGVVEDTYELFRGVRYKDTPEAQYDFVFVDGPHYLTDPSKKPLAFDLDFINIVQRSTIPVGAIVDTRTSTEFVFSLVFPEHFRYDHVRKLGIVRPVMPADMADTRAIVSRAMHRRAFKKPSLWQTIFAQY